MLENQEVCSDSEGLTASQTWCLLLLTAELGKQQDLEFEAGLDKGQLLFLDLKTPAVIFLGGILLCSADSYA